MSEIGDLRNHLSKFGQEHLLQYWDTLNDSQKNELFCEINEINFELIIDDFRKATSQTSNEKIDDDIKPVPESLYGDVNQTSPEQFQNYEQKAFKLISESKLAVLVLAGGQGTRLGVSYPKGMYDVGLQSHKTLFQLQAERILRLQELACQKIGQKGCITWLVMTSESTMGSTADFFQKNNYFGLDKDNVIMFEQFMLPAFSFEGKIILTNQSKIAMSPDGNGGLYRALRDRKVLDELDRREIEYVHAYSIDNILVKVGDPQFIGYCAHQNSDCGVKVIEKVIPDESIGVVCQVGRKWKVLEYSEISPKVAEMRADDGSLLFKAGNICNHLFSTSFLRKVADQFTADLELHIAKKKIPTIDKDGVPFKPKIPNGMKMERFIFDVFPFAEKLVVWKVNRDEEFSPLKNADDVGKECPSTARRDLYNLHKKWLEKAGGKFDSANVECEISPLLSYAGEDLEDVAKGKVFTSPCYLDAK